MDTNLEAMELQLGAWAVTIESLAAAHFRSGVQASFDALIRIDELRALHVVARTAFDRYRTAGERERAQLEPGLTAAWDELAAAMRRRAPRRNRG